MPPALARHAHNHSSHVTHASMSSKQAPHHATYASTNSTPFLKLIKNFIERSMVSFHLFHKVAKLYKVLCLISCNHEKKFFDLFDRKTLCYTLNLNSNFYLGPSTATSISSFPSSFCAFFFPKILILSFF